MSKVYYVRFGSGDPRLNTGLAPTFLCFNNNGAGVTPPSIAEVAGATGIYSFTYGTTTPIAFLVDGFTTGLGAYRYVTGGIDPADRADEYGNTLIAYGLTAIALGTSNIALGNSNIALGTSNIALGTTNVALGTSILATLGTSSAILAIIGGVGSTFGGQTTDPIDLFGYMKRFQELMEGDNTYIKVGGVFDLYSRGSSTLLRAKTITNSVSTVIKNGQ